MHRKGIIGVILGVGVEGGLVSGIGSSASFIFPLKMTSSSVNVRSCEEVLIRFVGRAPLAKN